MQQLPVYRSGTGSVASARAPAGNGTLAFNGAITGVAANDRRRNTAPNIAHLPVTSAHTPPPTAHNSVEDVRIPPHALSEPRSGKPDRPSLTTAGLSKAAAPPQLPPLTGMLNGSANSSVPQTSTALSIARSARIPLAASPAVSPRVPPDAAPDTAARQMFPAAPGARPTSARPSAARPPVAPTSSSAGPSTADVSAPAPPVRDARSMQAALRQFNARVQEENEREKARLLRRNSRMNSQESSMSTVPGTSPRSQPPAAPQAAAPAPFPPRTGNNAAGSATVASSSSSGGNSSGNSSNGKPPVTTATGATAATAAAPPRSPASPPRAAPPSKTATATAPPEAPPLVTQGPRTGLPRSVAPGQPQQPPTKTAAARPPAPQPAAKTTTPTPIPTTTPHKAGATAATANRTESDTPPVAATPRLNKNATVVARAATDKPHIAAARLPPPPRAAPPATASPPTVGQSLPERYAQPKGTTSPPQPKPQRTLGAGAAAAAAPSASASSPPLPQTPNPSPIFSAVEVYEGSTSTPSSSGGFWNLRGDSKRGASATADRAQAATASAKGKAAPPPPPAATAATAAAAAPPAAAVTAPLPSLPVVRKSTNMDELDDAGEDGASRSEDGGSRSGCSARASAPAPSSPSATGTARPQPGAPSNGPVGSLHTVPSSLPPSAVAAGAGERRPLNPGPAGAGCGTSPLTALPVFSATDEKPGKQAPSGAPGKRDGAVAAAAAGRPPKPDSTSAAGNGGHTTPPQGTGQGPDSALARTGRYTPSTGNGRVGSATSPRGSGSGQMHHGSGEGAGMLYDAEAATLCSYLREEDLNLSMSTFNSVGTTLAQSLTLRVLNLKGSTIPSEGLRGLADIPTLKSICVSHMRYLTTLEPLVTPTARANGRHCAIEEIDAQFSPLVNEGIWGLENLRRLRRLDLGMTPISDVTCLAASRSLSDLYLTGTRVDSQGLAGLERVPTLVMLNVARTKVNSLKQVARSRSMQTLIAYSCQIPDDGLVGVSEMPRLATLDVSTTKVTDLSVLQKSRSLKSLRAQWLSLKNCHDIIQERRAQLDGASPETSMAWRDTEAGFSGLANIPTLETVDLSFNSIRSFHSLCRSRSLKHLVLRRTRVDNAGIGSVAKLAATLETLVLTNLTDILDEESDDTEASGTTGLASGLLSTIGDVHQLRRLTAIDLSFTDVFDLRMLQDLRALRELSIVETLVTVDGLRGIEKIPTLEVLDISQTSVISLQFLVGGAPALKKLLVKSNRNVRGFKLGRIEQLRSLEHLDVSDTVVEDMDTALKPAWRIRTLVWRWKERRDNKGNAPALECWVTSPRLAGINSLPCLTTLDLTNSSVHELAFLECSTSLTTLTLKCCRLLRNSTIKGVGTLPALEVLELTDNRHITDVTCLRNCRRLREVYLHHTHVTKAGLNGVTNLPELKVLDIANTRAEDDGMDGDGHGAVERSRLLEDSNLREGSTLLDSTAAPAQFRVPRRRRVSFVAHDGPDAGPGKPS